MAIVSCQAEKRNVMLPVAGFESSTLVKSSTMVTLFFLVAQWELNLYAAMSMNLHQFFFEKCENDCGN
jgi:hypothetical protein